MRFLIGIALGLFAVAIVGKVVHGARAAHDLVHHQASCNVSLLSYAQGGTATIDARVDAATTGEAPVDPCSK